MKFVKHSSLFCVHIRMSIRIVVLFLGFVCMLGQKTHAQGFTMTGTTVPSTCANNGAIFLQPKNGTPPYQMTILSGPSVGGLVYPIIASQGKTSFLSLPPGQYTVKGEDFISGVTATLTLTVGGGYRYPVVSTTLSGTCIVCRGDSGTRPLRYAISSLSPNGPYSPYQSDSIFCPTCGKDYYVRVEDSCSNFYSTVLIHTTCPPKGTAVAGYRLKAECIGSGPLDSISIKDLNGKSITGLTFKLSRPSLQLTNNTGIFGIAPSCDSAALIVTDSIGRVILIDTLSCSAFSPEVQCADCTHGTATVALYGGFAPYKVVAYILDSIPVDSNSTGIFTSLPPHPAGGQYRFKVTDACGKKIFDFRRDCLKVRMGAVCPFKGEFYLAFIDSTFNANKYDTSAYGPLTFTCLSCSPVQVKKKYFGHRDLTSIGSPLQLFSGLVEGTNVIVRIQDSCGADEIDTVRVKKGREVLTLQLDNCSKTAAVTALGFIDTLRPFSILNPLFYFRDSITGALIDSNRSGLFRAKVPATYYVTAQDSTCQLADTSFFKFNSKIDTVRPICTTFFHDKQCNWRTYNAQFVSLSGFLRDTIISMSTGLIYSSLVKTGLGASAFFIDVPPGFYKIKSLDTFCSRFLIMDSAAVPKFVEKAITISDCTGSHSIATYGYPSVPICNSASYRYKLFLDDTIKYNNTSGNFYNVDTVSYLAKLYVNQNSVFGFSNPYDSICPVDSLVIPKFFSGLPTVALPKLSYFVCGETDSVDIPYKIINGFPPFSVVVQGFDTFKTSLRAGVLQGVKRGSYTIIVSDKCGISSSIQFSVVDSCIKCSGKARFSLNHGVICLGDTFIATNLSDAAQLYLWSVNGKNVTTDSNFTFVPTQSGYYTIGLKLFELFCKDSTKQIVKVDTPAPVRLGPDLSVCNSFSLTLTSNNDYTTWSTGVQRSSILVTAGGIYWAEYTNACGTSRDSVNVEQHYSPVTYLPHDTVLCPGDSTLITLHSTPPATYVWSTGSTDSLFWVSSPGTYSLTVLEGSCPGYDSIKVSIWHDPTDLFDTIPYPCIGDAVILKSRIGTNPVWQDTIMSDTLEIVDAGLYKLTVQGRCNLITDSIRIRYRDCNCQLYVPTAFSPNADGSNDGFRALLSCRAESYELNIFNRWGELVYQTNDPLRAWDGIYLNAPQPMAVYVYTVKWRNSIDHADHFWEGNVTLVR
jgi:gliding motility-associated-like protein